MWSGLGKMDMILATNVAPGKRGERACVLPTSHGEEFVGDGQKCDRANKSYIKWVL